MPTPEQIRASLWEDAPEDPDERRMFDLNAKCAGGPLMAIAIALVLQSRLLPPQGSQSKWCAIAANEVARAAAWGKRK